MQNMTYTRLKSLLLPRHAHLAKAIEAASSDVRDRLVEIAALKTVRIGDVLPAEGGKSTEIGYVVEGALGMTKTLSDGRVHIVGILVPTDMYGRLFDGPAPHRLEALADSTLLCFDRGPLEDLLRTTPELEQLFLVSVFDELDAAREWILLLNGTNVVQRVVSFLLILARRENQIPDEGPDGPVFVNVPMRRRDFARCLGIRPESLSRAIHRLADDGVIEIVDTDCFAVPDLGALIEASGQDLVRPAEPQFDRRFGSTAPGPQWRTL